MKISAKQYTKWVRQMAVEPAIEAWGKKAWSRFGQEQKRELVAAKCMSMILGWARVSGESGEIAASQVTSLYSEAMRQISEGEEE